MSLVKSTRSEPIGFLVGSAVLVDWCIQSCWLRESRIIVVQVKLLETSPTDAHLQSPFWCQPRRVPFALGDNAPDTLLVFHYQTSKDLDSEIKHQWMQRCCWTGDYNLCVTAECEEPHHGFVDECGGGQNYDVLFSQYVL